MNEDHAPHLFCQGWWRVEIPDRGVRYFSSAVVAAMWFQNPGNPFFQWERGSVFASRRPSNTPAGAGRR